MTTRDLILFLGALLLVIPTETARSQTFPDDSDFFIEEELSLEDFDFRKLARDGKDRFDRETQIIQGNRRSERIRRLLEQEWGATRVDDLYDGRGGEIFYQSRAGGSDRLRPPSRSRLRLPSAGSGNRANWTRGGF